MAKKKKKQESEGNFAASAVLGAVAAFCGLLLGIFTLAIKPVAEVREMPTEENIKPKTVYYVLGNDRGGDDYKRKEKAFLDRKPGTLILSEEELNRWAADTFKFAKPTKAEDEPAGMILMSPSAPNFRIKDGVMQIGLSVEVEAFGVSQKMRYFAKGVFEPSGAGYAFTPEMAYLGSAELPPVGVGSFVGGTLFGIFQNTERYAALHEAWISLAGVQMDGSKLLLIRQ